MESGTAKDKGELKRKMILFGYVGATHHEPVPALTPCRSLEEIKDELRSMLERTSAVGYKETDADAHTVGGLAEDVRDAVIEYQVSPDFLITLGKQC